VTLTGVRDDSGGPVVLDANHRRDLYAEEQSDLLGDRGKDLGGRRLARDHRRHASQRGLLLRKKAVGLLGGFGASL
jgi:hypothetical protein